MNEHQAVLLTESIAALNIEPQGIYIDATFGRGGHSRAILDKLGSQGRLLVIDKDPEAAFVAKTLAQSDSRVLVHHGRFCELKTLCETLGWLGRVQGLLMDLGVSSPQLNTAARGFSFLKLGPLDMRMDSSRGMSAAEWLAQVSEPDLVEVFKTYGEERYAKRIAKALVQARAQAPIQTTQQLAELIKTAHPAWEKHKHPATRCFQAIRIFINQELDELNQALEASLDILAPKGRLVVISFHSLEDRIVKQFIQKKAQPGTEPHRRSRFLPPLPGQIKAPMFKSIGKKIKPTKTEIQDNIRARSAVMRVAERLEV